MKAGLRKMGLGCVITFSSKVRDQHWYMECEVLVQNRRTCTAHQGDEKLRFADPRNKFRQRWLFETHCPMCCPARDGLRSKVRSHGGYVGKHKFNTLSQSTITGNCRPNAYKMNYADFKVFLIMIEVGVMKTTCIP